MLLSECKANFNSETFLFSYVNTNVSIISSIMNYDDSNDLAKQLNSSHSLINPPSTDISIIKPMRISHSSSILFYHTASRSESNMGLATIMASTHLSNLLLVSLDTR